jgi:hypothetical protein
MAFDFPSSPTNGQIYQGYTWDGEKWVSTFSTPNVGGVIRILVFGANATYVPSPNMTTGVAEGWGGGGGGGSCQGAAGQCQSGGGGGAGAKSIKYFTAADIGASKPVVIGLGGAGGPNGVNNGSAGGDTSLGSLLLARGGQGGGCANGLAAIPNGGDGGGGGVGDVTGVGMSGGHGGMSSTNNTYLPSGRGGSTELGGGGRPLMALSTGYSFGINGAGPGAGGSGGATNNVTNAPSGGNGAAGYMKITEYGIQTVAAGSNMQGAVRYDQPQSLTSTQQAQARSNIGGVSVAKNYIINGAMMVSQEWGTTMLAANGGHPVDQWHCAFFNQTGVINFSQVASRTPSGSPNRIRITVTTADAGGANRSSSIRQPIEGWRIADLASGTAAAKTVTFQFGCKGPAGTYCAYIQNYTGAAPTRSYVAEFVIAAGEANVDVVKSVTIPLDQAGAWASDTAGGMYIGVALMTGSISQCPANTWQAGNFLSTVNQFNFWGTVGNVFELFDVGLYVGAAAPAFTVPDYARELAECMRYYFKDNSPAIGTESYSSSAGNAVMYFGYTFKVRMRIAPSITQPAYSIANCAAPVVQYLGDSSVLFNGTNQTAAGRYWALYSSGSLTGSARM